jgi:peptidyl-prolyl cis-trans isomerase A (cyclophilin A)
VMRYISIVAACCIAASCASVRLEKLAASAQVADTSPEQQEVPSSAETDDELVVTHRIQLDTTMGTMVLGLYGKDAPNTVENFLSYVRDGYFDGLVFHRVIPGFMIQGGGYQADMEKKESDAPIPLELIPGLRHGPGTISMARTSDPTSATSQFFVCVADTEQLNGEYAAFGKVEEGLDVAVAISRVETHSVETDYAVMDDVPVSPVVINTMKQIR